MNGTVLAAAGVGAACVGLLTVVPDDTCERVKSIAEAFSHPAQVVIRHLRAGFRGLLHGDVTPEQSAREEKLRAQVAKLALEVKAREADKLENTHLKRLLGFRERDERTLVTCSVIRRGDSTGWYDSITLDKGTVDGLEAGMAVMSENAALVGCIKRADRYSSVVELITAPKSMIPCWAPESNTAGLLCGAEPPEDDGHGGMLGPQPVCFLSKVSKLGDIEGTDVVYTSGFGDNIPPGLFVGFVESVEAGDAGILVKAKITPAADLRNLKFVFAVVADK